MSMTLTYPRREPRPEDVIALVAERSGFSPDQLTSHSRARKVVTYRHVAMAACRLATGASFPAIARAFSRDHSTVVSAVQRVERDAELARVARRVANDVLLEGRQEVLF